jgi:Peptidase A4 family
MTRSLLSRGALAVTALALSLPAGASAATSISSNWAGYVVRPSAGKRMRSVSGTWVEPAVNCTAGQASYSAVWVGLGGYRQNASALEQIGTDSDCTRGGRAVYSSWVELLPAAPLALRLKVHPGDRITASVTVIGSDATLGIRNLSTGARTMRTLRLSNIDVSSAEWIVEAPSDCLSNGNCRTLPLADFGRVKFTNATATIGASTSTIPGGSWGTTALELEGTTAVAAGDGTTLALATPSNPSRADGSFAVTYSERQGSSRSPEGPTLPGFRGGPPG